MYHYVSISIISHSFQISTLNMCKEVPARVQPDPFLGGTSSTRTVSKSSGQPTSRWSKVVCPWRPSHGAKVGTHTLRIFEIPSKSNHLSSFSDINANIMTIFLAFLDVIGKANHTELDPWEEDPLPDFFAGRSLCKSNKNDGMQDTSKQR